MEMKRVLLKLSGEALAGPKKTGFDEATVLAVAKQIKAISDEGVQIGIVIGGGNFWRGRTSETIDRNKADQIGMLATIMNCIYVSDLCRYTGMKTEIYTPFVCGAFTKLYSKDSVEESFAQGKLVFFAGGTGHPYFSTDTGAVLRAIEIEEYYKTQAPDVNEYNPINSLIIGIHIDRELRREKISRRLRTRLDEGMVDEVRTILATGVKPEDLIYYGLEYKFLTLYIIGELSFEEMVSQLEIAIHQFAKRQMTWFRGMERRGCEIHWIDATLPTEEKIATTMRILNNQL